MEGEGFTFHQIKIWIYILFSVSLPSFRKVTHSFLNDSLKLNFEINMYI